MRLRTFFVVFALWIGVAVATTYVGTAEEARIQSGNLEPAFPPWVDPIFDSILLCGMIVLICGLNVRKEES